MTEQTDGLPGRSAGRNDEQTVADRDQTLADSDQSGADGDQTTEPDLPERTRETAVIIRGAHRNRPKLYWTLLRQQHTVKAVFSVKPSTHVRFEAEPTRSRARHIGSASRGSTENDVIVCRDYVRIGAPSGVDAVPPTKDHLPVTFLAAAPLSDLGRLSVAARRDPDVRAVIANGARTQDGGRKLEGPSNQAPDPSTI